METKKYTTLKELLLSDPVKCSFKFKDEAIVNRNTVYNLFDGRILFSNSAGNPVYMEAKAIAENIDELMYEVEDEFDL